MVHAPLIESDSRKLIDSLHGRLVVSCQPVPGGPMDTVEIIVALARAALAGGACGLRIEGVHNVAAVRAVADVPLIGIVKRDVDGQERITPDPGDVQALADAGADIIAMDATRRPRRHPVGELIEAAHGYGRLVMADCSDLADGREALGLGADLLGTTLSGYTGTSVPEKPDYALIAAFRELTPCVFAEGRYNAPAQAAKAMQHGAWAVVVGSAITRVEHITGWFDRAVRGAADQP